MPEPKRIAILGSTGSIGTQALDVIRRHPGYFSAEILTAHSNAELLCRQALEFMPNAVVIGNQDHYLFVKQTLEPKGIKVFTGQDSVEQIVESDGVDMVLAAIVGFAGLRSTLRAIGAGKTIALANKETLVVAGDLITKAAASRGVNIYPVDSEHSAIFQCLAGEFHNRVEKIFLTASGGPFRGYTAEMLQNITIEQALAHPNWQMGNKITIDSATLMNKGLEVIEARWLFGLSPQQIEVVVHPQSVIHSMVQFADGSIKAQMGLPDMRLPILYALSYPNRIHTGFPRFSFSDCNMLSFSQPDTKVFRNLQLAYDALNAGGNMPCILNAANETAVSAFLGGELCFASIPDVIAQAMTKASFVEAPTLDDYTLSDAETRQITIEIIKTTTICPD